MIKQALMLMAVTVVGGGGGDVKIPSVSGTNLVSNIFNTAYFILGFVAVGMLAYAGIQYMTANGDPNKIKQAHSMITFAIVGIVLAISAYAITDFIIGRMSQQG